MLFDFFGRRNVCGCDCPPECPAPYERNTLPPATPVPQEICCCPMPRKCCCPPALPPSVLLTSGTGSAPQLTADAGASTNFAVIGTGGAIIKYAPISPSVTLTPAEQAAAVVLPSPAVIRSLSVSMTLSAAVTASSASVYAALLSATTDSDVFGIVPGSTVVLASGLTSATPAGSTLTGYVSLCACVTGKLALAVFATDVTAASITGYVQGMIGIR